MADKKTYLDQEGLERLVAYIQAELSNKLNRGEQIVLPEDLVHTTDLANYAQASEVTNLINSLGDYAKKSDIPEEQDLSDYVRSATLNDYATTADLERVEAKATSAYHVKGSVTDLEALQAIDKKEIGDVYNLEDTGINAVWTGEFWDELGTFVDLTPYVKKTDVEVISRAELNRILFSGKTGVVTDKDSLVAMIANNEPEVEIVLNKNMQMDSYISIPTGKKVTLNLDGNKINGNSFLVNCAGGELVLKNGELESLGRPVYVSGGTVTLDNAIVTSKNDVAISATGTNSKVILNNGKVTAQESGVLVTTGAILEVNGGEIECFDNCPIQGNGTSGQGNIEVVMNGGKLTAHIQSNGYTACGVYMPNNGKFIMNGGEIISDGAGIVMRAGEVELNGGSVVSTGESGVLGKVGDSKVTVGPYAVVYDEKAAYPGLQAGEFKLTIGKNMNLQGTDGDISILMPDGKDISEANIIDNRQS